MARVQLSKFNLLSFDDAEAAANRRRRGRIRCDQLACPGGTVLDLSHTGARLRVTRLRTPRVGRQRIMVFETAMGPSLDYSVVVRWVRALGLFRHEVGVEFLALDEPRRQQLAEIGRVHGVWTIFDDVNRVA